MKSRLVGEKVQTWFGRLSPLRRSRYFIVHRLSLREKKKEPGTFLKLNSKTLRWLGSNATRPDVVWRLSLLFGNRYNDSLSRSLMVEAERPGITNRTATHAQLHTHSYTRTARLQQLCFAKVDSDAETEFEKLRGEGCSFPGPLNEAH